MLTDQPGPPRFHNIPAECEIFTGAPGVETSQRKSWYARGQNFLVEHSQVEASGLLDRVRQVDEYIVIVPDAAMSVSVTTSADAMTASGPCLIVVPPGRSTVRALGSGRLIRVLTTRAHDLVERCQNATSYVASSAQVAPINNWPAPPGGFKTRVYPLDIADQPGRFGRIFRCTTLMINYLAPQQGPRDRTALSPHSHTDFEQGSLALNGEFVHHLRWPWGPDSSLWRADEHIPCASPSLAVIPPEVIHTTEAVSAHLNQLVDVFCPPRLDFSEREGWVLNASDYPHLPDSKGAAVVPN